MGVAWRLLRALCPSLSLLVRGPLNARNIIPQKFIFSEPDNYAPLLAGRESTPEGGCCEPPNQ